MLKINLCLGQRQLILCGRLLVFLCLAMLGGCTPPTPVADDEFEMEAVRPDPLTMLVIDEPEIGEIISRQWSARRDGELTILNQTSAEFAQSNYAVPSAVDMVLYPPGLLAELESRDALLPLPRTLWLSDELNKNEFLRMHRGLLIRHDNEVWAVPLGGPQISLMYNRGFVEQNKIKFPIDWDKLIELVGKSPAETDEPVAPTPHALLALPLGEGWAVQVFLTRLAPMIRNRGVLSTVFQRENMQPLITDAPFVLALEDLKKLADANPQQLAMTPDQVFEKVISGQVEMGLTWPGPQFHKAIGTSENEPQLETELEGTMEANAGVGFTTVAGTNQWFDLKSKEWMQRASSENHDVALIGFSGLIGSVVSTSRNAETGFRFLEWLASKSTSLVTVVQSPLSGPFRKSHLADPSRWTNDQISDLAAQEYAKVIETVNENDVVFMFPRIPGRQSYLDTFDQNIRSCLRGEQDPNEALEQTAEQWNAITDELGREKQISELRADAGL